MAVPAAAEAGTHDGRPDSLSVPVMDRRIVSAVHHAGATGRHEEARKSCLPGACRARCDQPLSGTKTGGTSRPRPRSSTVDPSSRRPPLVPLSGPARAHDRYSTMRSGPGKRAAVVLRGVTRDPRLITTTEAQHLSSTSSYGTDIHASRMEVVDRTSVILWSRRILSSTATRWLTMRLIAARKTARKDRESEPREKKSFS